MGPEPDPNSVTCDSCGHEWWGATKRDAVQQGWKFHLVRGGLQFIMCDECQQKYAPAWRAAAA
jgi:hypothetical protein